MHQMIAYANTVGEKVTFHFSGRSGTFELAESLKFVEDGSTGSVADSFILSALASPPPPLAASFDPTRFEKSMIVSALVTIGGLRQAKGTFSAFVQGQMRGVSTTPSQPPFGPYSSAHVFQMIVYADDGG